MNPLVYGILPLVFYVLVDSYARNLRTAVTAAIAAALLELGYMYIRLGRIDGASAVCCALLILFGLISIRSNNPLAFKLQPAIVAFLLAGFVAYLQFFSEPLLVRYAPLIEQVVPKEFQGVFTTGEMKERLNGMINLVPLVIILHGLWILYAARYSGKGVWLAVNAGGFFVLLLPIMIGYLLLS